MPKNKKILVQDIKPAKQVGKVLDLRKAKARILKEETIIPLGHILQEAFKKFFSQNSRKYSGLWPKLKVFAFLISLVLGLLGLVFFYQGLKETKEVIQSYAYGGYGALEKAQDCLENFDFKNAQKNFSQAASYFTQAQKKISRFNLVLKPASLFSDRLKSSLDILALGRNLARVGETLSSPLEVLEQREEKGLENWLRDLSLVLVQKRSDFYQARLQVEEMKTQIASLRLVDLSPDLEAKINKLVKFFPLLDKGTNLLALTSEALPDLLGFYDSRFYLILFENNYELRSGGGFIGSYGILNLERGQIKSLKVEDVYKLDNPYTEAILQGRIKGEVPPGPRLSHLTNVWALRDSAYSPDFSLSAQKSLDFFNKESQISHGGSLPIKGVIGLTQTFFQNLLKFIGPISLPEYGLEINSDNFFPKLQIEIEAGRDKLNYQNPKTILSLLSQRALERLENLDFLKDKNLFQFLLDSLEEKQLMFYFPEEKYYKILQVLGFENKVKETNQDYLLVTNDNYGGFKSSLSVEEEINLETNIDAQGLIRNKLNLKRTHLSDYFYRYYDNFSKEWKWLIGENKNYLKIYVPKGSQLLKATLNGQEVTLEQGEELGKTYFGLWTILKPRTSLELNLEYQLPFQLSLAGDQYTLLYQKQPGAPADNFSVKINLPPKMKIESFFPQQASLVSHSFIYQTKINSDGLLGLVIKPE